ncbi:unnamed protein product [Phyllotreta striolata]|uniref:Protein cueball n=1 Tax=Phyllotreta striolata TaxID=444603 RepID=A0A9N9TJ78_PHYSR|nr:unnamed protein product [Phyllotreta striolata]
MEKMSRNSCTLAVLLMIIGARCGEIDWDLAIAVENEIKLLDSNGSEINSQSQPFSSLKALVYDGIRDQFIVSDTDGNLKYDTIFTVRFNKETDTTVPIIRDLPGDIQGMSVDPLEDVLYWTDLANRTINYVNLNGNNYESNEYLRFNDKFPHAITVDVCNRYIYYTNPSAERPTIERMKLDKTGHEVLVSDTIMSPVGLTVSHKDQRLYWADSRIGAEAGRIESIALDGSDRKLVVERTAMVPFGLAVDDEAIYWTDTVNKALYKFPKSTNNPYAEPQKIAAFSGIPMGLASKHYMYHDDCRNLTAIIKEYQENQIAKNDGNRRGDSNCLNGFIVNGTFCQCQRGFVGKRCEMSLCDFDYCLNGHCYFSTAGKPVCNCRSGFFGARCEKSICDRYCLNEGKCETPPGGDGPKCSCIEGFFGDRCEHDERICDDYCDSKSKGGYSDKLEGLCRCNAISAGNNSMALKSVSQEKKDFLSKLDDPVVYLSFGLILSLIIIIALSIYIRHVKKIRPRIKKRIIVNKNVTPLTYRPQANTEQCEITIENCCNMNVCETPCFEPREDKKTLLKNMEGDDLY